MLGDPLFWILVLPGLLLGIYAQARIKANVAKYSHVSTRGGITGAQVARELLDSQGLRDVAIESTPGMLSGPRRARRRCEGLVNLRNGLGTARRAIGLSLLSEQPN
jgi:Zn-dependent membrane protease YugP